MCLYPRLIKNKRYLMYNGKAPRKGSSTSIEPNDQRKLYVSIGCGHCIECRKQKAHEWQIRLMEELKIWKNKYFVTLTFSPEALLNLCDVDKGNIHNVNNIARIGVRRFLERWRKKHKKSLRHWLITELGHEYTERIHLHGLIFSNEEITNEELEEIWKYGHTDTGKYCNERTINYIVKYVTKVDNDHIGYEADIFCSAGIGSNYINESTKRLHKFKGDETIQYYKLNNGAKVALPIYYRNKLWTQEERDQLWTQMLDENKTYVRGMEIKNIDTQKGYNEYMQVLETQQQQNKELGFGDTSKKWDEKIYKVTFDMLNGAKGDKKR